MNEAITNTVGGKKAEEHHQYFGSTQTRFATQEVVNTNPYIGPGSYDIEGLKTMKHKRAYTAAFLGKRRENLV